jgi:hypothetical protein
MSLRRKTETFEPVTVGHIRSHGCRDLLAYCNSGRCRHSATMNGGRLSDETPVCSLCLRMVCTKRGMIGADVRPDWGPHVNATSDRSTRKAGRAELKVAFQILSIRTNMSRMMRMIPIRPTPR